MAGITVFFVGIVLGYYMGKAIVEKRQMGKEIKHDENV